MDKKLFNMDLIVVQLRFIQKIFIAAAVVIPYTLPITVVIVGFF
jgi:hypothetical protein